MKFPGLVSAVLLVTSAFATTAHAAPASGGSDPQSEAGQPSAEAPPRAQAPTPTSATRLLSATNALVVSTPQRDHENVVQALRALAAELQEIVPEQADRIAQVREAADKLERSHPTAITHSDFTREGLDAAVAALSAIHLPPNANRERFCAALEAMKAATKKVDPDALLLDQYPPVRAAFEAAVRAAYAASGCAEPALETGPAVSRN